MKKSQELPVTENRTGQPAVSGPKSSEIKFIPKGDRSPKELKNFKKIAEVIF